MSYEALYYPHMRIDNAEWLRSQLLFFDRISTISPWHVSDVPPNRDEEELGAEGLLVRRPPNFNTDAVERASRFMTMLLVASQRGELRSHFSGNSFSDSEYRQSLDMLKTLSKKDRGASIQRLIPNIRELKEELKDNLPLSVSIHPEKLEMGLQNFLRNSNRRRSSFEGAVDWINVDPVFASIYMTILAREMSVEMGASGVTDEPVHDALFQDIQATRIISKAQTVRRAEGVAVDLIMKSLKITPDTALSKILKFRRSHKDELERFRMLISEVSSRCASMGNISDIRREAELILRREIDPAVEALEKSLSASGIFWSRSGILKITAFLFTTASGLATFDFTGSHYAALSASLGLGLTTFGIASTVDRFGIRDHERCSYLLNLRRDFS